MSVLVETGRVPVTTKAILGRLQERWPTEHGYAPQIIGDALEALRQAGSIHCSVSGRWTRSMKVNETSAAADRCPECAGPIGKHTEVHEVDCSIGKRVPDIAQPAVPIADKSTQEIEVAGKTKVCKGKCGKEKPVGEFYTNCSSCKRCVLDRQKELKAVKGGHPGPTIDKTVTPADAKALRAVIVKAAAKKNGHAAPAADSSRMLRMQYQLVIVDTVGDKHEFMVDLACIKLLQAELKEVA